MAEKSFVIENGVLVSYKGRAKEVEIPADIDRIGSGAFKNNSKLEKVSFLGKKLKSIDENAFYGCVNLKGVKLPDGLVQIGDYAFFGCTGMEYIYIPSNVVVIGTQIVESKVTVLGSNNSEAEKYAKSGHLAFKTNFEAFIHSLEQTHIAQNNVETKTFEIFGEKITVSNSLARYHDIIEYYTGRKEPLYETMLSYVYNMGDKSKKYDPNGALDELKKAAVKRLEKSGIFIAETRFLYIIEPMKAILEVYKAASTAYVELAKGVSEDIESKADMLYSQAESQVTGLSYGYIGDSFGLAVYGIDDFLTKQRQRKKAYAQANSQMNAFKEQHIAKGKEIYREFCDKIAPFLYTGVSAYVDAICKTEIEYYISNKLIDSDIIDAYDVEKSAELVSGLYSKSSPNPEFVIALALKKYPMNMAAHIYAIEKELSCDGLEDMCSFLGLNDKLYSHKTRVRKEKIERVSSEVMAQPNAGDAIKVIEGKSFLFEDEIKRILTSYSVKLTKSVEKIIDINPSDNASVRTCCEQKLNRYISKESWFFFDKYGVMPINSREIPRDYQQSLGKVVDYLETAIKGRQEEKAVQLKAAEEALSNAETRQELESIISSLAKISGYKNTKELYDKAVKKKLALEQKMLDEIKEEISKAKTSEELNVVEKKINKIISSKEVLDALSIKKNEVKQKEKKKKLIKIFSVIVAIVATIIFLAIYDNTAHYRDFKKMTQTGNFNYDISNIDIKLAYDMSYRKWACKTLAKRLEDFQENDDIKSAVQYIHESGSLSLYANESFMDWLILGSVETGEYVSENEYVIDVKTKEFQETYLVFWQIDSDESRTFYISNEVEEWDDDDLIEIDTIYRESYIESYDMTVKSYEVGLDIDYSERIKKAEEKIEQDKLAAEQAIIEAEKAAEEAEKAAKEAEEAKKKSNYEKAVQYLKEGKKAEAAIAFGKAGDYLDAKEKSFEVWDEIAVRETISAGNLHTVALREDGTAVAVGDNENYQCGIDDSENVVAVDAFGNTSVELGSNHTIYIFNSDYSTESWNKFANLKDIVAVSAGGYHTACLKYDGTVVVIVENLEYKDKWKDVESWTDIVAVSAGSDHTVGLKSDGTVVAVGNNRNGQCNVEGWADIVAVSAGYDHTIGLKSDGTVVAVGDNENGQCNVGGWTEIVAVSAGTNHTVGLKSDGTVVATKYIETEYNESHGQCDVSGWTDIVAISAGYDHTVGLKSDGTVVATEYIEAGFKKHHGQCNVSGWKDIKIPNNLNEK